MTMAVLAGGVAVAAAALTWSVMLISGRGKQQMREAAVRVPEDGTMALDVRARWSGL
jgi:hypothetical protein